MTTIVHLKISFHPVACLQSLVTIAIFFLRATQRRSHGRAQWGTCPTNKEFFIITTHVFFFTTAAITAWHIKVSWEEDFVYIERTRGEPNTKRRRLDYKSEWEEGRPWLYFQDVRYVRNGIENLGVESKFGTKCLAFAF